MSCCSKPKKEEKPSCCSSGGKKKIDWIFWISLAVIVIAYPLHFFMHGKMETKLGIFTHGVFELINQMWWGVLFGIAALGFIGKVPRELIQNFLGQGGTLRGIARACGAGLLLDLCNHGILMVGAKLYERGASLGQVFAFLIASPWNSLSLTLILWSLVGLKWTLLFILGSAVIAIIAGYLTDKIISNSSLPKNPNTLPHDPDFKLRKEIKERWKQTKFTKQFFFSALKDGVLESKMIIRWLFLGTIMAAGLRAFIQPETFSDWFGPSVLGLVFTLIGATVIEVCSEGSLPIGTDLLNRAGAPGNAFAFLMAGASTDYTEIMVLRETTKSLKLTFLLPILTLPQIILIALMMNAIQ
ncbi:hypothetical protein SAMN02745181_1963 [Rubritalea squalenifaciens DSM 18772]|uniref:ATPase n=2 Tax=Rubritalea TaxID=361050 RepID=A0A1M6IZQ6_9BACT|nr:permease [Rubritalea squalenifaciens]SHJ39919.1 hypothetical protein SAMN02745181_1963 [Rubritalea squalenifaciens DSM 18772]